MDKDSIVYGFNLTFGDLMDMVNYMNDSKEDEIN